MNYEKMTDFEINKAVAIARGYAEENCDFGWTGKPDVGVEWSEETGYPTKSFNYCNSWADAGPIIAENKITILTDETTEEWSAAVVQDFCDERAFKYSNCAGSPLRAAMVTFLKMQESKCSN